MSEITSYPDTYIEDYDMALEVAYAGKELRCLAAAGRMVDAVLAEHVTPEIIKGTNYHEQIKFKSAFDEVDIDIQAKMANDLFQISTVYPEAFAYISNKPDQPMTKKAILDKLALVVSTGGLPITTNDQWVKIKRASTKLDEEAELSESVAAVLYDSPPSPDFLRDCESLVSERLGFGKQITVEKVKQLLASSDYYRRSAVEHIKRSNYELETLNGDINPDWTRTQRLLSLVECVENELSTHQKNTEYGVRVAELLNSEDMTYAMLKQLWIDGTDIVVKNNIKRSLGYRNIFKKIISGEAATYVSAPKEQV